MAGRYCASNVIVLYRKWLSSGRSVFSRHHRSLSHRRCAAQRTIRGTRFNPSQRVRSLMTTGQRPPSEWQTRLRANVHPRNHNSKLQFGRFRYQSAILCVFICSFSIGNIILINMHEVAKPAAWVTQHAIVKI